jgi:hypothetical protein
MRSSGPGFAVVPSPARMPRPGVTQPGVTRPHLLRLLVKLRLEGSQARVHSSLQVERRARRQCAARRRGACGEHAWSRIGPAMGPRSRTKDRLLLPLPACSRPASGALLLPPPRPPSLRTDRLGLCDLERVIHGLVAGIPPPLALLHELRHAALEGSILPLQRVMSSRRRAFWASAGSQRGGEPRIEAGGRVWRARGAAGRRSQRLRRRLRRPGSRTAARYRSRRRPARGRAPPHAGAARQRCRGRRSPPNCLDLPVAQLREPVLQLLGCRIVLPLRGREGAAERAGGAPAQQGGAEGPPPRQRAASGLGSATAAASGFGFRPRFDKS